MIGKSLLHYEVTARLGAGGMGEVYQATDPKLGREVAIKVLTPEVAQDAERRARFEREARLLASLNHPNIAHVYGFEAAATTDGSTAHFLVMELVEGEDLSERLTRGPLPFDEALVCARQIAEALEEAHERGIVHRDLKPANIKLTPGGTVKVLDFGLARALAGETGSGSSSDLSQSPTLAHTGTQAGVILGTAAYMSPEQARGKPVDKRADIWAFGVVLYEMLTGRPLFTGETVSDILAGVLRSEVDLTSLPEATPPVIRHTLRRCLERDPKKRLRDVGDVELEGALEDQGTQTPGRPGSRLRAMAPWATAALVLVAWLVTRPVPHAPAPVSRTTIELPRGFSLPERDRGVAISPDETALAIVLEDANRNRQLYLRPLNGLEMRPLDGTDDASYPFWSPDGRALGFFAHDELRRFDLPDGPVRTLSRALSGRGASWGEGDTIVFAAAEDESREATRLYRIEAVTPQAAEPIGPDTTDASRPRLPLILPDGGVLFDGERDPNRRLYSLNGSSADRVPGGDGVGEVQYVPSGHVAFIRDNLVMVQRFDPGERALLGTAQIVADRVKWDRLRGTGHFSISTSALVYLRVEPEPLRQLTWFDREGRPLGTIGEPAQVVAVAPSPDGTRALVTLSADISSDPQLWMVDLPSGLRSPFTRAPERGEDPVWSPDGRRVAFRGPDNALVIRSADGASPPDISIGGRGMSMSPSGWSPDGSAVIINWTRGIRGIDLAMLSADGEEEPRLIVDTPAQENRGALSPDGQWLAYVSDESGQDELYLTRYPDLGRRWPLTGGGLSRFQWTGPSRLLYEDRDRLVYALSFREGATGLVLAPRQPSFGGKSLPGPAAFVPALDRFLVAVPVAGQEARSDSLVLVTNWQSELQ